jgi:hypothetical protein
MSNLALLRQQAEEDAIVSQDMTVATTGGTAKLFPAGYAFCRLVEYIEQGDHMQSHNNVAKGYAPESQLAFAVWGEGIQNDDGTPAIVHLWAFNMSTNEKAKAFKLFKKLNYKGTAKRFSQLLGEGYLMLIEHSKPKKAGDPIKHQVNLEGFLPPYDTMTKVPYPIPEAADNLYKLFLWNTPNLTQWTSLFVDGKWDDGKSKNKQQDKIMLANNFSGSPVENLLISSGTAYVVPPKPVAAPTVAPAGAVPAVPAAVPTPVAAALPSLVVAAVPAPVVAPAAVPVMPTDVPFDGGVPTTLVIPAPAALPVAPALAMPSMPSVPALPQ